jgi:hypothetical protein
VEFDWEWQRFGSFRGLADGLEVAEVAYVSGPEGAEGWWIVLLTGQTRALPDHYPTEFDAMVAAEIAAERGTQG